MKDKKKITDAVNEFNKYHGKISKVNLISINKDSFKIKFKGHFCHTCGFYDYFDDFRISLEENNLNADILNIKEINEGAIVKFISKNG